MNVEFWGDFGASDIDLEVTSIQMIFKAVGLDTNRKGIIIDEEEVR